MSTRALIFHFRLGPAGARLAHSESEAERVATRELSALRYANVNVGLFCSLKGLFCLYIRPLLTRVRTSVHVVAEMFPHCQALLLCTFCMSTFMNGIPDSRYGSCLQNLPFVREWKGIRKGLSTVSRCTSPVCSLSLPILLSPLALDACL